MFHIGHSDSTMGSIFITDRFIPTAYGGPVSRVTVLYCLVLDEEAPSLAHAALIVMLFYVTESLNHFTFHRTIR